MPTAQYLMPDGRTAEFDVPEGTTPDQAKAYISQIDVSKLPAKVNPHDNDTQYDAKTGMPYTQAERNAGVEDFTTGIETGAKQAPFWLNDLASGVSKGMASVYGAVADTTPEQKAKLDKVGLPGSADLYKAAGMELPEAKTTLGSMGNLIGNAAGFEGAKLAEPLITKAITAIPEGIALRAKGFQFDPEKVAAQSDTNWADASAKLNAAHNAGAVLTPQAGQDILTKVKAAVGKLNGRHADTQAELADFEAKVNSGQLTLSDVDEFRQNFGDVIKDNTKSKIDGGGLNSDGMKSFMAKKAIGDSFDDLATNPSAFSVGTAEAAAHLKEGINQYAQAARYDRIGDLVNKADGDATAMQRLFKNFTDNPANLKGYSPEEIDALKSVANRGAGESIERGLGTFGFDLGRTKNVALPYFMAGEAARAGGAALLPHGVPLAVAGTVARQTGKYAARGKASNALETIMGRETSIPVSSSRPWSAQPPLNMQGYSAPIPPAPLALPAPQTTITVDNYGRAIPLSEADRQIIGLQERPAPMPSMQEVMQMPIDQQKAALDSYLRNRNYRR